MAQHEPAQKQENEREYSEDVELLLYLAAYVHEQYLLNADRQSEGLLEICQLHLERSHGVGRIEFHEAIHARQMRSHELEAAAVARFAIFKAMRGGEA